jgi:hypothetical protein
MGAQRSCTDSGAIMYPAWVYETAMRMHGWQQSQVDGSWLRKPKRDGGKTVFVAGPYKPEYSRDCELVLKRYNDDSKSKIKNGYKTA